MNIWLSFPLVKNNDNNEPETIIQSRYFCSRKSFFPNVVLLGEKNLCMHIIHTLPYLSVPISGAVNTNFWEFFHKLEYS